MRAYLYIQIKIFRYKKLTKGLDITTMKAKRLINLAISTLLCVTIIGSSAPIRTNSVYAASYGDELTTGEGGDDVVSDPESTNNTTIGADANSSNSTELASTSNETGASTSSDNASTDASEAASASNESGASDASNNNGEANSSDITNETGSASDETGADSSNNSSSVSNETGSDTSDSSNSSDETDAANSSDSADSSNASDSTSASDESDTSDNADSNASTDPSSTDDNAASGSDTETSDDGITADDFEGDVNEPTSNNAGGDPTAPIPVGIYTTPDVQSIIDNVVVTVNGNAITDPSNIQVSIKNDIKVHFTYTLKDNIGVNVPEGDEDSYKEKYGSEIFVENNQSFTIAADNSLLNYVDGTITEDIVAAGYKFATVTMAASNVSIQIDDQAGEDRVIQKGEFGYDVTISKSNDAVKDAETVTFSVNGVDYTLVVSENQKVAPKMTASGTYDGQEFIDWNVSIKNDEKHAKEYAGGYDVVIELKDGQEYKPGTMKLNGTSLNETKVTNSDGKLTVALTADQVKANNTFTFQTKPETESFMVNSFKGQPSSKAFNISAKAATTTETVCEATAKATVSKTFETWITKGGGVVREGGYADWTVTIKTNGYSYNNLVLYDKYKTDSTTSMILSGDVKVDGVVKPHINGGAGDPYDFKVELGDIDGETVKTIVVTYTTQIENYDDFLSVNHTIPANSAWLTYDDGNGTTITSKPAPDIKLTGTTLTKSGIDKSVASYDAKTHQITWKVVANKNKRALTNAKITDTLGEGQKLVAIKGIKCTAGENDVLDASTNPELSDVTTFASDNSYTLDLGNNLNKRTIEFTVVSQITDSATWEIKNADKKYTNSVDLYNNGTKITSDAADYTVNATAATLISDGYDYNTHCINYKIAITDENLSVTKVNVADTLGEGVVFEKGSLKVGGETYTDYEYKDGILTIKNLDFPGNKTQKTITFTGKVTDETISNLGNGGSTTITNSAIVYTNDGDKKTLTCDPVTIKNLVLSKTGSASNKTNANFTVKVNGGKQTIPAGTVIKDTLGRAYELDMSSVHIYVANINSKTGELTADTTKEYEDVDVSVAIVNNKTELSVKFKNDTKDAFVLKYTASPEYADKYSNDEDFHNNIELIGTTKSSQGSAAYTEFKKGSFSSAYSDSIRKFTLTVKDKETGEEIPDVTYDVYDTDEDGATPIATLKTGYNGSDKLMDTLDVDKTYYLRQVKVPDGYKLNTELIPVKIANRRFVFPVELEKLPDTPAPGNDPSTTPVNDPSNTPGDSTTPGTSGGSNEPGTSQGNPDTNADENKKPANTDPAESNNTEKPADEKPKTEDDKKDEGNKPVPSGSDESGAKPSDPGTSADEGKDLTQNTKDSDSDNSDKNKDDKSKKKKDDSKQKKDESKEKKDESKDSKSGDNTDNDQNTSGNNSEGATTDANGSSSDDSNASGSTSNGTTDATNSTDAALNKENGDLANADAANATNEAGDELGTRKKLAKTGGFFGTLYGYLVGLLMIIAGAVITFKKRKEN